jgi:competence protein ComEA
MKFPFLFLALLLVVPATYNAQLGGAAKKLDAKKSAAPLDINSASLEQLEGLPEIGKVKAKQIVAGRPFKGKDELVTKKILSEKEYALIKDLIVARQK